jgi:hypothetical protein
MKEEGSFQKVLRARRHEGEFGGDAEALVSPQREALTGFAAGGAAGSWHALLALSLAKVRFAGIESIKLDRAEAVMMFAVCKEGRRRYFVRVSREAHATEEKENYIGRRWVFGGSAT